MSRCTNSSEREALPQTALGLIGTFDIDPFRKHCLLNGLDDIGLTLEKAESIAAYEKKNADSHSWL